MVQSRGEALIIRLDEVGARIAERTHEITGIGELMAIPGASEGAVQKLVDSGILYREQNQVINLAVRVRPG